MFIEQLKKYFNYNEPIFTEDILTIFKEYSRPYVFRLIKKAEEDEEIIKFSNGIYYLPTFTFFGKSTITADMVAQRKYINWNKNTYGVYSGLTLLNQFFVTTQVPNVIEIVTNNESMRCREINIDGRKFILRKSRITINKDNAKAYALLQLFSELKQDEELGEFAKRKIIDYINNENINKKDILLLALNFPARTMKNLIRSGVLDEAA